MLYCCRPIWQVCILHVSIIRVKAVEWPKNFINFFQQEAIFTDVFFTLTPTALGCRHQMLPPCPWNRCWQCIAEQGRRELGSWGLQKMFREHGIDFISGITCWPGHSWWTEQWAGWARSCQRSGQRWRGNPAKCVIPSILTFVPSLFTYDLLLSVLVGGEQVDGLHLAEVDVVAEEEDEEQLAHILLLLVPVQRLVPLSREISQKSFLRSSKNV